MRIKRRNTGDADLDVTSFMNLMIILVPVLLMGMVLSRITVLDLKLPDLADPSIPSDEPPQQLEVIIRPERFEVNYPSGVKLRWVEKTEEGEYDYETLSTILQETKRLLEDRGIQKKDLYLLSESNTEYRTIISTMDTVRSFRTVVAASVVNAELFPEIALGDAPPAGQSIRAVTEGTK